MYIVKNAFRCITRTGGRSILIGVIVLVIAVSACLGLSIREAAKNATETALAGMRVTATISPDRAGAMGQMGGRPGGMGGEFDRGEFENMMGGLSSLTLGEYEKYAAAESVDDFYYTLTAYLDGSDALLPVSDGEESGEGPMGRPGGMGFGGVSGDFSVIGYSSYQAMTAFLEGTASILAGGAMFEEGTAAPVCVISEELAIYNGLAVGDVITVMNPLLSSETYTLEISGIYRSSENNDFSMSAFGTSQDPANHIYMSATALQSILDASLGGAEDVTDEGGNTRSSGLAAMLAATYAFADTDAYYAFLEEVRELGLSDSYTVSSSDLSEFEQRITPLETLGKMAGWFLLVILLIGGVILVVLNIFNVRERKYEVGVLTAMGMKKWKVATQFVCEILIITMLAVTLGVGIGAVSSVPVTNALLEEQIESRSSLESRQEESFGRPGSFGGEMGETPPDFREDGGDRFFRVVDYIAEVDTAMNLTVVLQMMGIGLLLTLIASAASVLFVMRYDPLGILTNRD